MVLVDGVMYTLAQVVGKAAFRLGCVTGPLVGKQHYTT